MNDNGTSTRAGASRPIDRRIGDEAARWHALVHSGEADSDTIERFQQWLRANEQHRDAYALFEQIYRDLDYVALAANPVTPEVTTKPEPQPSLLDWLRDLFGRPTFTGGMVTAAIALVAALFLVPLTFDGSTPSPQQYSTQIAQIGSVDLEDGTRVTLGPATRLETEISGDIRKVTLLEGEAFFDVAHDTSRPFFVVADGTLVRVVGTRFNVKIADGDVRVAVVEGKVEVIKPDDVVKAIVIAARETQQPRILTAGETIEIDEAIGTLPSPRVLRSTEAGTWRSGLMAYEDATLDEIVADLSRYRDAPVRVASGEVGALRSTLAFDAGKIDQFIEVIEAIHPVKAEQQADGTIIIRTRK